MTEFVPMLKTPILGDREHLRGTQYYLPSDLRERFNRDYIKEIEARGKQIVLYDTWYLRYYREPYMATFSKDQFVSRWADIWDNLLEITPELKVTVAPPSDKTKVDGGLQ